MRDRNWKRPQWSYSFESVLVCIGVACNDQVLHLIPYNMIKHGRALFLIPFIVSEILIGLPCTFLMLSLGQFTSSGVITCWNFSPISTGFGVVFVTSCFLRYTMMLPENMTFLQVLFRIQEIPISSCKEWNSWSAKSQTQNTSFCENYIYDVMDTWRWNQSGYDVEGTLDSIGDVNWTLALLSFGTVVIVILIVILDTRTLGKVAFITVGVLLAVPIILFVRGLTLPGANEMANLLWKADASKLKDMETWSDAFTSSLYGHGIITGFYITIGSFNHFHNDCFRDSLIIVVSRIVWGIFGTHAMFCIIGFVMRQTNTETIDPAQWLFNREAMLSLLPEGKIWIGMVFFYFISAFIQYGATAVLTIITALTDCFPTIFKNRKRRLFLLVILCVTIWLLSLPMATPEGLHLAYYLFNSVDRYHLLTLVGFCLLPVIGFFYGVFRFCEDVGTMTKNRVCCCLPWTLIKYPFIFLWTFGTFYTLLASFVLKFLSGSSSDSTYERGHWTVHLSNFINALIIAPIPLCAFGVLLYYLVKTPGEIGTKLNAALKPTKYWGPLKLENRKEVFSRWRPYGLTEDPWSNQTEISTSEN
ncbi:sodium- and chloride-dependent glycine transporter 2-like isoform X2 [Ostrea edulis]|nr:sodium- and chloride-dependent glycine transporter 2-like isoform X2 [Ostrea edulis]XP_048751926.2 sodium- and chloride-dependent glycine transporter 2-like isoform X2 [Ostrea edulis]XP_048751928.2 sodium- and chloride-dependent glycine transporter 2-like isoform X2 [Ostrea edulis]